MTLVDTFAIPRCSFQENRETEPNKAALKLLDTFKPIRFTDVSVVLLCLIEVCISDYLIVFCFNPHPLLINTDCDLSVGFINAFHIIGFNSALFNTLY